MHPADGHQIAAVHPHEAGRGPDLLQVGQRQPDEVGALGGVQPYVVAVRLHELDVVTPHEHRPAAVVDLDDRQLVAGLALRAVGRRGPPRGDHPGHRLGQPLGPDGLEQVVHRADAERLDGVGLRGGDEDDGRRGREPADHPRHVHPVQTGHGDVQEDGVEGVRPQRLDGSGAALGRVDLGYLGDVGEEVGEFLAGGGLVLDDENPKSPWRDAHSVTTPRMNRGTRIVTLVPLPGAVSRTSPYSGP